MTYFLLKLQLIILSIIGFYGNKWARLLSNTCRVMGWQLLSGASLYQPCCTNPLNGEWSIQAPWGYSCQETGLGYVDKIVMAWTWHDPHEQGLSGRFVMVLAYLNPLMLTAAKTAWQFWWHLAAWSIIGKIFIGEMLIRTLTPFPYQIFCKMILKVIV